MGRAGAGGCGGGAPRPHGPMTPAGPTPARSARSRPPPAAQREPVPGEVVGRDSSRGQPSPKFDAGRAGCKVAAATDSDGWVASRLRAARACHLGTSVRACALGWRRGPRELSGCSERRTIDPPSSEMPRLHPWLCTSSSGRLRAAALVILLGGPSRDQRLAGSRSPRARRDFLNPGGHTLMSLPAERPLVWRSRPALARRLLAVAGPCPKRSPSRRAIGLLRAASSRR